MSTYSQKRIIKINWDGDCAYDEKGRLVEDNTPASRVIVRLRARRGEYLRDPNFGSRLHLIKTIRDAKANLFPYLIEAEQPLIDEGVITTIETGKIWSDPGGVVAATARFFGPSFSPFGLNVLPVM